MPLIEVESLVKEFSVAKKDKGMKGALKNLFYAKKETLRAVDGVSFAIDRGEIVGYIGPNGAGKSTTIKMMCGILRPTAGSVRIGGLSPQSDRKAVVAGLGVVFGQRTQLYWDLRLGESFELLRRIYRIEQDEYEANLHRLDEVLGIKELIDRPVRQLSLGQRMRGDIAASMLHSPPILFLDEPSIGLDVEAKYAVRNFIKNLNAKMGTTVILTTHDLDDLQQLCNRVIIINHGKIVEDGALDAVVEKVAPWRYLILDLADASTEVCHPMAETVRKEGNRMWLRFEKSKLSAARLVGDLMSRYAILDLSLTEPDIEDVVREIYR